MKYIFISVLLLLACFTCGQQGGGSMTDNKAALGERTTVQSRRACSTLNFHYLTLENSLYSPTVRHIEVFLDESAFSEDNLTILFARVASENPTPQHLTVVVNTNWKQLPFPSDCPPGGISEQSKDEVFSEFHGARYFRREDAEYFQYNPQLNIQDFKTVNLRKK